MDVLAFLHRFTYVGILLALLGRGVGVPLPEDIPLLAGGWLCATGVTSMAVLWPWAWGGVIAADCISYTLGRHFGPRITRAPFLGRIVTEARFHKVKRRCVGHESKAVFFTRFMPGMRSPFFFVIGALGISFRTFIIVDAAAALLSVSLLIWLGWFFGDRLNYLINCVEQGKWLIPIAIALFFALLYLAKRFITKFK